MQIKPRTRSIAPPSSLQLIWLLPLFAGMLPALGTIIAFVLSVRFDLIPSCNPFFDGCVSISGAARHGLSNHIFRTMVIPGATLQAITWILCSHWLRTLTTNSQKFSSSLVWLGVLAGVFLTLYATFLGTEGETYQWLRRFGINFYFGFTYLCMLLTSATVFRATKSDNLHVPLNLVRVLGVLCLLVIIFGVINLLTKSLASDAQFADRLENVFEWHASFIFTLFFVLLAWLWKYSRFGARAERETRKQDGNGQGRP